MKKVITIIVLLFAAVVASYLLWSASGRTAVAAEPELYLDDISSYGVDSNSGNLVAVQPYMIPADYASLESYRAKLDAYMAGADAQGWLQPDTIVVFPEEIGAWLVVAREKQGIYEAQSIEEGMPAIVFSNLPAFLQAYVEAVGQDRIRDAIFRMKADTVAEIHQMALSELAEKYQVTIVGGSVFLPEPAVVNGQLMVGEGPLYNVATLFKPDGTLYPQLIRKAFITSDEVPFVSPADVDQPFTFQTPAGQIATMICADAWYLEPYERIKAQNPRAIVVPNAFLSDVGWEEDWGGPDGWPLPADVDSADIGRISEGEALLKYTLNGRMQETGAETGMHVFLRGDLWNLKFHGHTIIFTEDEIIEASPQARGALVNYWLPE